MAVVASLVRFRTDSRRSPAPGRHVGQRRAVTGGEAITHPQRATRQQVRRAPPLASGEASRTPRENDAAAVDGGNVVRANASQASSDVATGE